MQAIIGAEYLLNWLPRGTHDFAKFIRPSELSAWARKAGLNTVVFHGLSYQLGKKTFYLSETIDVNYIAVFEHFSV